MHSDMLLGRKNTDGPILQPCLSGGLWDGGTSIIVGDVHIANWVIGQVRNGETDPEGMLAYAAEIGADPEKFESALEEVTIMPTGQFRKISNFLYLMASQLSELAYNNIQQEKANREKEELQEKLNHKNKMDAIGQLSGGIAHDFNNMLGGILGASQYLKSSAENLNEESAQYIDIIIEAAERAADLTGKLLTFSRKSDRIFYELDLHKTIVDTMAILESSIDKRIQISFIAEAERHIVNGNATDLQNSLLNLGINSSHAMEEHGGDLIFKTANISIGRDFSEDVRFRLRPGEYIKVTVKDTGCGISRGNLNRIFEPFFTTKEQGRGTGLGLSAVYGIMESHRGGINVYSEENSGTEFCLYLPLSQKEIRKNDPTVPAKKKSGTGRVYLVDDEEIILVTVSAILKGLGYQVETFQNPVEAAESYGGDSAHVDLVISDMTMPEMSGVDLFYRLKEMDPRCKVVISSGFSQSNDLNRMIKDGLAGYINKPFSDVELSLLLEKVLA